MPNGLRNWTFEDIVRFLEQHYFLLAYAPGGSHHYYKGFVDGKDRMVEVQFHRGKSIKPNTLKWSIIPKSGIPEETWIEWAKAGNNHRQKKVRYPGAQEKNGWNSQNHETD